jgi:hypothetical protein
MVNQLKIKIITKFLNYKVKIRDKARIISFAKVPKKVRESKDRENLV